MDNVNSTTPATPPIPHRESTPLIPQRESTPPVLPTSLTPKSLHRKIQHAHKLEKKHSSGDLHSRLKTRKLLGVGETDDGDVHRSKLSQILGHSEQLYVRLPKGLRVWQFLLALMFTLIGLWALILPRSLFSFALSEDADSGVVLPIRLYGAALISFSVMFWSTLQSSDKDIIRWSLVASSIYFSIQIIVTSVTLLEQGTFMTHAFRLLSHRFLFGAISLWFYYVMGITTSRMRKSNSNTNLYRTSSDSSDATPSTSAKKDD